MTKSDREARAKFAELDKQIDTLVRAVETMLDAMEAMDKKIVRMREDVYDKK